MEFLGLLQIDYVTNAMQNRSEKKFINAEAETKDGLLYNCISSILLHLHSNCGNKIRVK